MQGYFGGRPRRAPFSACGTGGAHAPRGPPRAWGRAGAAYIGNVLQPGGETGDARGRYAADLEGLSADSWRQRFAGDEED